MITLARTDGARVDVLERITHNAAGAMIDTYTYFEWDDLCDAVSCIRLAVRQSSDGDPGIAQKRPNCRSESALDNFRSGSDRRLKSFGFSTELVIKIPDPL